MEKRKTIAKHSPLRRALEISGGILLIIIVIRERAVFADAWKVVTTCDVRIYVFALLTFWLTYAWSAIGYKVLAHKARFWDIVLVNIAASGAGKVIPGGAGFLTFGTAYLHNKGYKTTHALAMATTNNTIGFIIDSVTLAILALTQHDLFAGIAFTLPGRSGYFAIVLVLLVMTPIVLSKKIKKAVVNFFKSFADTMYSLVCSPGKLALICLGSFGVMLTNALVLFIAAHSIGMGLSYPQAIITMSFGVALGSLLPTPGGVGGVEAGLIATLVLLGFDAPSATATALLFRLATYIQPFIPGIIMYFFLRKKRLL